MQQQPQPPHRPSQAVLDRVYALEARQQALALALSAIAQQLDDEQLLAVYDNLAEQARAQALSRPMSDASLEALDLALGLARASLHRRR